MKPISKQELTILLSALFLAIAITGCKGTTLSSRAPTVRSAAPANANTGTLQAEPTTRPARISTDFSSPLATPTSAYTGAMASHWVEYWDQRYGYGLAIPRDWIVYPTPLEGQLATLEIMNYDDNLMRPSGKTGHWPEGALKIDVTVYEGVASDDTLSVAIRKILEYENAAIESIQEKVAGSRTLATANLIYKGDLPFKYTINAFRISPDKIMVVRAYPENVWKSPDVQAILNSVVFSRQEKLIMPSIVHGALLIGEEPSAGISTDSSSPLATPTSIHTDTMTSHWVEYWDQRYGYGLAIPSGWIVYPTPLEGQPANLTVRNFDDNFARPYEKDGNWPDGMSKIFVTVYEGVAPDDTLSAAIRKILENESTTVESTREKVAGSRTAATVILVGKNNSSEKNTANAFRVSPDKIMVMNVLPEDAWKSPDVQAILNSIVFSHQEKLIMPSIVPGALLVGEPLPLTPEVISP